MLHGDPAFDEVENVHKSAQLVWDTGTLAWIKSTGSTGPGTDVTVTNTVTITGTVTAAAQPGVDIGDVTVNNAAGAAAVNVQDGGNTLTVDGTVTANPATSFGKTITFVSVAQGAAGTTALAVASAPNKHKLVGVCLVGDAAGTVSFTDGTVTLCGAMSIAANAGFVLPTSILPYTETAAINRPLNLVTVTAKVSGMVAILTEP